jgi:hypothetical protein
VIVVAHGDEVDEERWPPVHPERRRGEERALGAVGGPVAQDAARRAERIPVGLEVVLDPVEVGLDPFRRREPTQGGQLGAGQAVHEGILPVGWCRSTIVECYVLRHTDRAAHRGALEN